MKAAKTGGISPLMKGALIVTLLLTAASFGVRQWREQQAALLPAAAVAAGPAAVEKRPPVDPASPVAAPSEGLRAPVAAASVDAMASRLPPPPPPGVQVKAVPPPPPPPSFRLIGAYADEGRKVAIFAYGNQVLTVRPGDGLPEDFILKALHPQSVVVQRQSNKEQIEMHLGKP